MRILIVQPHGLLPGPSMYAQQLCDALHSEGHQVTLLSAKGLVTEKGRSFPWLHREAIRGSSSMVVGMRRFRFFVFQKFVTFWTNWVTIRKAIRGLCHGDYDLVHILDSEPLALTFLNLLYGFPRGLVVTNRGYEFGGEPAKIDTRIYQIARRIAWRLLAHNITVTMESEHVWEHLIQQRVVRPELAHVVPHPVWKGTPGGTLSKREARKTIGIEYDGPLFLVFGHRPPLQKSPETIIAAVETLPKTFRILIAGFNSDAESDRRLEQMIRDAGWNADVYRHFRFIPKDEMGAYFVGSDAMILSYRHSYIGSSGVLNLACEYLLPVISSDAGDLGATVARYSLGLVFRTEDAEDLRETLIRFLQLSPGEVEAYKDRMRSFTQERSWENIVNLHLKLYARVRGDVAGEPCRTVSGDNGAPQEPAREQGNGSTASHETLGRPR